MTVQEWLGEDNNIGIDIWQKKYQYNNEDFDTWITRVSGGNKDLAKLIINKKFLFGGRILANRGLDRTEKKVTLSNCYVTGIDDSIEEIFDAAKRVARTFSYGGGIGIDITPLAPNGAKINNAAKTTSGAVSFMELFSTITGLIGQSGRRGALMISLSCEHPDIEDFINIKTNLDKITYANISVRMTNAFMQAVTTNSNFTLSYTRAATNETISKTINARELFHKIAANNWKNGEPGILFWDTVKNWNLLSSNNDFKYSGVNPCAEEPLPAGGSCLLGSINLSEYVENPFSNEAYFNYNAFIMDTRIATRALNDVLEEGLSMHPLDEQKESVKKWRQIGLGIFGLADTLIKLCIEYGSKESFEICKQIASVMSNSAIQESAMLAKERGCYEGLSSVDDIISTEYFKSIANFYTIQLVKQYGLRNSQILTIPPTGTISNMIGISGGLEPIFALSYKRTTKSLHDKDFDYEIYTPIAKFYMDKYNLTDGSELPKYFITSKEINPMSRIKMQSVWQSFIDASISSTINLPEETTIEEIEDIYIKAWQMGLKGLTIFRSNCDRVAILNEDKTSNSEKINALNRGDIVKVNDDVIGKKRKLITGCGSLHCLAFFDSITGELLEAYFNKGSTGGCNQFMIGLSRMISLSARSGCNIYTIVDQLNSCGTCSSYAVRSATKKDTSKGSCCPSAIGYALLDMYREVKSKLNIKESDELMKSPSKIEHQNLNSSYMQCPSCGDDSLTHENGCISCKICGYSKCD